MVKFLFIFLLASPVYGDLVITSTVYSKDGACPLESIIATDGAYMLMNCPQGKMTIKYDLPNKSLLMLPQGSKECLEYSKKTMEQLAKMRQQQMKQMAAMKAQMKNLPAEQRKMMEASMGGMTGGDTVTKFKPTARSGTVKKWSCKIFDEFLNSKKVGEHCMASVKDVGLDVSKYKKVMDFSEEMTKFSSAVGGGNTDSFQLFRSGLVTVQAKNTVYGPMKVVYELDKVSEVPGRYNTISFPAKCAAMGR